MTDVVTTPDDPVTVAPPSETLPPAEDQYQAGLQAIRVRTATMGFPPLRARPIQTCHLRLRRCLASLRCDPATGAQDNELEKAVELFANVLQTRIEHYGGPPLAHCVVTSSFTMSRPVARQSGKSCEPPRGCPARTVS